jgi:hypothetical protein
MTPSLPDTWSLPFATPELTTRNQLNHDQILLTSSTTMKFLIKILVASLLVTSSVADRKGYCWIGSEYKNCALCGPKNGFPADNANSVSPLPVLHNCNGEDLNTLQCAHQCKCEKGGLKYRAWNGCRDTTVTNHCKCKWQDAISDCKANTLNTKADDGGVCFCPQGDTTGTLPNIPP